MKKTILIYIVLVLLYSCKDGYHAAIPNDKIPDLKNNDNVFFQDSITSIIDTFNLSISNTWNQSEHDYFQEIYVYYKKLNSNKSFLNFRITTANVSGVTFIIYFDYMKFYGYQKELLNFSLNGISYQNLYILQDDTPASIPYKIFYTYKKGIIRYEYKDGRVYNLVSK